MNQVKSSYETFTNEFLIKKIITKVYSELQSFNSLGFNPVLQKFCEMVCEIVFSGVRNFLDFFDVRVLLIILLRRTGTVRSRKVQYLKTHLFIKNSTHCFEDLICANKLEGSFFQKNFFQ